MTILPHAASRQRPSADLLAQKLAPCNLNQIFFPGYAVVASDRTRESLTLKLEATEPAICPKCGEPCTKIHDTRPRLIRDAPFPGRGRNPLMLLGEWTAVIKSRLCHTDLGMEREGPLFFNYSAA